MTNLDFGALSPEEFCRRYSLGRTKFYQLVSSGQLRAVKAGRRTLVLNQDATAWAESLPAMGVAH